MSEKKPAPAIANLSHKSKPDWAKRVALGIVIVSLLFFLALLMLPMVVRPRGRGHDSTEAISNARQIGIALSEFETEYGAFPSAATQSQVTTNFPTSVVKGAISADSNGYFKQIFEAGLTQSEAMFYAKVKGSRKPDGDISNNIKVLEKGEVGFAYIPGLSLKDDPRTPIVLTPMIPGTTKFDPEAFGDYGKAIVLHIDGSVRTYKIEKDGRIYDKGIDLLSSKHPVWKGKKPDIRYPE